MRVPMIACFWSQSCFLHGQKWTSRQFFFVDMICKPEKTIHILRQQQDCCLIFINATTTNVLVSGQQKIKVLEIKNHLQSDNCWQDLQQQETTWPKWLGCVLFACPCRNYTRQRVRAWHNNNVLAAVLVFSAHMFALINSCQNVVKGLGFDVESATKQHN